MSPRGCTRRFSNQRIYASPCAVGKLRSHGRTEVFKSLHHALGTEVVDEFVKTEQRWRGLSEVRQLVQIAKR